MLILFAATATVSGCSIFEPKSPGKTGEQTITVAEQPQSLQMPAVVTVQLPGEIAFAGERIPLENYDTRESLQRELLVTMYMHSRTMNSICATARYFPLIEPVLEKNGIPSDFKYLCVAECGLDPGAVSSAKAAGLWQFLPTTGKEYGLEVGNGVDERYHIEKSTQAACNYFKKAFAKYKNWTLVAASYNVGMAGVDRRLNSQHVADYYDLMMPQETMRYLFRIVSLKLIIEDPAKYGYLIAEDHYFKPYEYTEVTVSDEKIDWPELAQKHGTNYKILREFNPWISGYEHENKAKKRYTVKVPVKDFRTR